MTEEFKLLKAFMNSLKYENRYFVDEEIKTLLETVKGAKTLTISKNEEASYYRGRILKKGRKKAYPCNKMGMPKRFIKSIGRFNSFGINHLYLASDIETVVAELRPDLGNNICIGHFQATQDITILNLIDDFAIAGGGASQYNPALITLMLGDLFSQPIPRAEENLDYLPMQYFAELCKVKKIEGIKCFSSLFGRDTMKYNFILFDESKVECRSTQVIKVNKVMYDFKNI
jgi:hypothetical protein